MTQAISGEQFLVKIGDGASPEVFTTIGELLATQLSINNSEVDFTNKDSQGWRELHGLSSIKSMQISGGCIYAGEASQEALEDAAMARPPTANFELIDGAGSVFTGNYQISNFEKGGPQEDVVRGTFTLASTGSVAKAAAP